jgi:hypothetical protein
MSTMEIPRGIYRVILAQTFVRYVDKGYSLAAAGQRAHELMESAFTVSEAAQQTEHQWDAGNPEANHWSDNTKLKPQT